MNLDRRADAIERAARAWADFYLWAQDQPNLKGARNRIYTGMIADDFLAAAGITFAADHVAYTEAAGEVIARGYELAGGKHDLRGQTLSGRMKHLATRAKELRRKGLTLKAIAGKLGVSATTIYKLTRHAA
jgi:hypothetical protein